LEDGEYVSLKWKESQFRYLKRLLCFLYFCRHGLVPFDYLEVEDEDGKKRYFIKKNEARQRCVGRFTKKVKPGKVQ
jgi:hypothetical protein